MKKSLFSMLGIGILTLTLRWVTSQNAYASCSCPWGYTYDAWLSTCIASSCSPTIQTAVLNVFFNSSYPDRIWFSVQTNDWQPAVTDYTFNAVQVDSDCVSWPPTMSRTFNNLVLPTWQTSWYVTETSFESTQIAAEIMRWCTIGADLDFFWSPTPIPGNAPAACTVDQVAPTCVWPVNWACWVASGVASYSIPTVGLCSAGTPSAVWSGGGNRTWSCNGINWWTTASCSAPLETLTCTTEELTPIWCDLDDTLIAWVCYIPWGWLDSALIVTDGKVWISTSTPQYTLDVAGTIRWEGIYTISDERAKKSIEKIDGALAKITKLNGYSFTWKDSWEPDLWLLAQEVEKVFKDAVSTDKDGNKTVQYNALLAPIIEAIHELNSALDEHYENKFEAQVKRIEAIENKLVK